MAEFKRCKTPFAFTDGGMTRVVSAGALVSVDDPAYTEDRAVHFEDIEEHVGEQADRRARAAGATVEAATAVPGEKRSVSAAAANKARGLPAGK